MGARLRSFLLILAALGLYALVNGFPTLYPDTQRYLAGIDGRYNLHSPGLVSFLVRPLFAARGLWGWYLAHAAVAAWGLAEVRHRAFPDLPDGALLLAVVTSMYGVVTLCLINDLFTVLGLVALLVVLRAEAPWPVRALLVVAAAAHYAHVPVFLGVAVVFLAVFRELHRFLLATALILASLLLNGIFAAATGGRFAVTSPVGMVFVANRVMVDLPGSISAYAAARPGSYIAANEASLRASLDDPERVWTGAMRPWIATDPRLDPGPTAEARDFVRFTVANAPLATVAAAAGNTVAMLTAWFETTDYTHLDPRHAERLEGLVRRWDGDRLDAYRDSLFARGRLGVAAPVGLTNLALYASLAVCVVALFVGRRGSRPFDLAVLAVAAVVVNALVMANLSGVFPRFVLRLALVPILAATVVVSALRARRADSGTAGDDQALDEGSQGRRV